MNNKKSYEKNIRAKCAVCYQDILVDKYGNGERCSRCGWEQCNISLDIPDKPRGNNCVSLDKARMLFSEGRSLLPSFEDFIEMHKYYGEVEFRYKGKMYGVTGRNVAFYEANNPQSTQHYDSIEDFAIKAHIDGVLVKDIWESVEDVGYMTM